MTGNCNDSDESQILSKSLEEVSENGGVQDSVKTLFTEVTKMALLDFI